MNFQSDHIGRPKEDAVAALCRNFSIELKEMRSKLEQEIGTTYYNSSQLAAGIMYLSEASMMLSLAADSIYHEE